MKYFRSILLCLACFLLQCSLPTCDACKRRAQQDTDTTPDTTFKPYRSKQGLTPFQEREYFPSCGMPAAPCDDWSGWCTERHVCIPCNYDSTNPSCTNGAGIYPEPAGVPATTP